MLNFKHTKGRFNYRTVGVITLGERLLVHRAEDEDFWTLPGGRVEFGEAAKDGLARELQEELGVTLQIGRLIWVVENFFTYLDEQHHEVAFYFDIQVPADSPLCKRLEPFTGEDGGVPLLFEWHSINRLEGITLYPSFLRRALADRPQDTRYIVHRDEQKP